ncbi:hypothetical protein B0H13DRAFT_2339838 [Mycena leptocephala]|nr:hypothetical protein B0H13DRAFT_2339838 [Mycena leptocephala]
MARAGSRLRKHLRRVRHDAAQASFLGPLRMAHLLLSPTAAYGAFPPFAPANTIQDRGGGGMSPRTEVSHTFRRL